jgi:tyrosine-protein kinase Etk/Wzc
MRDTKSLQLRRGEPDELDVKKLLSNSLRHWYLFILGVALCMGAAYLYLKFETPVYVIKSGILLKDDKKGPDLKGSSVFKELDIFKTTNNIENEMEVLRSKELMYRVLSELSMNITYFEESNFADVELYGRKLPMRIAVNKLDSSAFGKSIKLRIRDNNYIQIEEIDEQDSIRVSLHKFGREIKKPYGIFTIVEGPAMQSYVDDPDKTLIAKFHDIRKLAGSYNGALLIEPVSKTASVLTLTLKDPVPQKGKDILNKLIEVYDREGIEDKNHLAANTIKFLDERLQVITEELTSVEKDVEKYKRKNEITNVSSQAQSYMENTSEYKRQLTEWTIQINVLESLEAYLQKQGDNYQLVPSTLGIRDPTLTDLIAKFNNLQLERERLLRNTKPNNPLVQNINVQLSSLTETILENLRNIKNSLIITKDNLSASSGQFQTKIQQVPSIERHLLEINRQQGIKQGLYLYLLQKREESALALAATVSNIRIIDYAIAGERPISPNTKMIYSIALILGLGLPLGLVYVKELLNNKVGERKDVEAITATPILGEIAHNDTRKLIVVTENNRSPVAELFRLLRINLSFYTVDKGSKVIMITSSTSGEGKTFVSINLAASLVMAGKKVVILDMDLRKPKIMASLGLSNATGVTDYIMSTSVTVDDVIIPVPQLPGLFTIGTGPMPPNPAEFAISPRLGQLVNVLKDNFDHVIIDTAPVGQVSDALVLAPLISTTIYIVRYNYTYKAQLNIIEDIYRHQKLKNPMIVLNDANKKNSYGYGYGYGYTTKDKNNKAVAKKVYS